jgi:hypothetical protein
MGKVAAGDTSMVPKTYTPLPKMQIFCICCVQMSEALNSKLSITSVVIYFKKSRINNTFHNLEYIQLIYCFRFWRL